MSLRVVGAGIGRTGTHSLKLALEQVLGGPCYHMAEVFERPDDVEVWRRAARGEPPDWGAFLVDWSAAVDWPASAFWAELAAANPDAVVLLSVRESPEAWWRSAEATIFAAMDQERPPELAAWYEMIVALFSTRFTERWREPGPAMAAYERLNDEVRSAVPADRLVEWRPGDGWAPICDALGVAVPSEPFPHVNSTDEFRAMTGLDTPPA